MTRPAMHLSNERANRLIYILVGAAAAWLILIAAGLMLNSAVTAAAGALRIAGGML